MYGTLVTELYLSNIMKKTFILTIVTFSLSILSFNKPVENPSTCFYLADTAATAAAAETFGLTYLEEYNEFVTYYNDCMHKRR